MHSMTLSFVVEYGGELKETVPLVSQADSSTPPDSLDTSAARIEGTNRDIEEVNHVPPSDA